MDPLSEIIGLLKPRNYTAAGVDAGGDWSLAFERYDGIKCNAVAAGSCWLSVDGMEAPLRLEKGDCFLLPRGLPFRIASDLSLPSIDAGALFPPARPGGVVTCNGGGDFFLLGSRFLIDGPQAALLLGMLPPVLLIKRGEDRATLRWAIETMRRELREGAPGGAVVATHLAHMMLVLVLRIHMAQDAAQTPTGWLHALADAKIGKAIELMHGDPARRWTLAELAKRVGLSRTAFAARFKDRAGIGAMDYLVRWRMLLAGDRLKRSAEPISRIAPSLGYESESAFGAAFKRVMGCSPRQYANGSAGSPRA